MKEKKRRWRVRCKVCLLFLVICFWMTGCAMKQSEQNVSEKQTTQNSNEKLDVWFFACSEDADSILLQTEDADILIDTGVEADSGTLIERLQEQQVDDIELLILTHPDKDHIGGASRVLDTFSVEKVMQTNCIKGSLLQDELNCELEKNPGEEKVYIPDTIQELSFEKLQLTIYPPHEDEYKNSNNYSLGVLAEYDGTAFFFAGDAKKKRIKELLQEQLPDVDVYKVAHHGRDNEACEDIIERLKPEYAVVTAQYAEKKTQQALHQMGTKLYSTYEKDIHFVVKDGVLDVR